MVFAPNRILLEFKKIETGALIQPDILVKKCRIVVPAVLCRDASNLNTQAHERVSIRRKAFFVGIFYCYDNALR